MKLLCYFLLVQIGLFWSYAYSFKTLQEYKVYPWVSEDYVRDTYIAQMRTYVWTFGVSSAVMACCFSYWLATDFLPQYPKFKVLQLMFIPVAVGFLATYGIIFQTGKIYHLLKDPETRGKAMQYPIMNKPTPMRVFWVASSISLATFSIATMLMLEFLN